MKKTAVNSKTIGKYKVTVSTYKDWHNNDIYEVETRKGKELIVRKVVTNFDDALEEKYIQCEELENK
jgi:hypothetical protein